MILAVDDIQWADDESVPILRALLQACAAVRLLITLSCRVKDSNEEAEDDKTLAGSPLAEIVPDDVVRLNVAPLSQDESAALVRATVGESADPIQCGTIFRQSSGRPFLVELLCRELTAGRATTLDGAIQSQVAGLPDGARRFLEVAAIAGQPTAATVVAAAAEHPNETALLVSTLAARGLIRTWESSGFLLVEIYHDEFRRSVVKSIPPNSLSSHHLALAKGLEATDQKDYESLAAHYGLAGLLEKQIKFTVSAAERATDTLALERAVSLYSTALALCQEKDDPENTDSQDVDEGTGEDDRIEAIDLMVGLASAEANAGRGYKAAMTLLDAAKDVERRVQVEAALPKGGGEASPVNRTEDTGNEVATRVGAARYVESRSPFDLRRQAVEELLKSGHLEQGFDELKKLCRQVGLWFPSKPGPMRLAVFFVRKWAMHSRLHFAERKQNTVPLKKRQQLDLCWSAALGLSLIDPFRCAYFHARLLRLSMKTGNRVQFVRALAGEIAVGAIPGGVGCKERGERLCSRALGLADRDSSIQAFCESMRGTLYWLLGEWETSRHHSNEAQKALLKDPTGLGWMMTSARIRYIGSLIMMGQWKDVESDLSAFVSDAEQRHDVYAEVGLKIMPYRYLVQLAEGDADGAEGRLAEDQLLEALEKWPSQSYDIQQCDAFFGLVDIALYDGRPQDALSRIRTEWRRLERSLML